MSFRLDPIGNLEADKTVNIIDIRLRLILKLVIRLNLNCMELFKEEGFDTWHFLEVSF